tara:strand:+ start:50 stop:268 length:219 start_codon:yes stop_codon:yes gene_type:complete
MVCGNFEVMNDKYSINEILNAVNDLQNIKKNKVRKKIKQEKIASEKKSDIPSTTLRLIEEAEKTIRSKLQSE